MDAANIQSVMLQHRLPHQNLERKRCFPTPIFWLPPSFGRLWFPTALYSTVPAASPALSDGAKVISSGS